jgi:hypothetical protein
LHTVLTMLPQLRETMQPAQRLEDPRSENFSNSPA